MCSTHGLYMIEEFSIKRGREDCICVGLSSECENKWFTCFGNDQPSGAAMNFQELYERAMKIY